MYNVLFEETQAQIMQETKGALSKIKEYNKSNPKIDLLTEMHTIIKRADKGKDFFEPYDITACETKMKVDLMYYNQLMQNLDESITFNVEKAISTLYRNIKDIYEFINIKPEIYGKNINETILEDSVENSHRKLSKVIFEFLDKQFYSLDPKDRVTKYLEESRDLSKKLISEGTAPEDAIAFSVKAVVMESLLTKVAFPFSAWGRIQHLTESVEYGKVFDQPKLLDLVESFKNKVFSMSKIVSTTI
jgi:hypothetical protein